MSLGFALVASAWAQTPWPVPDSEKNKKSPIVAGPKVVEQGKKVAQANCASCRGAMPSWKHVPESDRWALVQYIRSVKK
jgi:mono/diheme cytochrome c family protein